MIYPITSKCNQRCIFCSAAGRDDGEFSLDEFKNFLAKADRLIAFSGGEPFTLPISRLIYLVKLAVEAGKTVELQTNATKIADLKQHQLKLLISLLNKTHGYFNINLPSYNKTTDYKITSLAGGFEKRMKAINILKRLGATIRITHVITKLNYTELPSFAKFLLSKKDIFDWVQFSFVKAIGKAANNKEIVPRYGEVSPYLIEAMRVLNEGGFSFYVDHIPLCFLGEFYDRHVDVMKVKKGLKGEYMKEKKKIRGCRGCQFYKICSGPRIDYIKIYGGL